MTNAQYCYELTRDLPGELRVWLDDATRGLGRIGITRVVEDIGAHYEDASRVAIEDDTAPDVAARVTLTSLGSPRKARRRFRRIHLTLLDEASLGMSYRWAKGKFTVERLGMPSVAVLLGLGVFDSMLDEIKSSRLSMF